MTHAGRSRRLLPVLAVVTVLGALAASTASGSPRRPAGVGHLTCRAIISLSAIDEATKLTMSYSGRDENGSVNDWWDTGPHRRGAVPGSGCLYNPQNPDGAFAQFQTEGTVEVGYGESVRNWNRLRARSKHAEPNSDDMPDNTCAAQAPESTIQVGYGSKAFVNTINLVSCEDSDPTDYPELPSNYYLVTVFTKRHDLLTVGFYNADLPATEGLVEGVLKSYGKSF